MLSDLYALCDSEISTHSPFAEFDFVEAFQNIDQLRKVRYIRNCFFDVCSSDCKSFQNGRHIQHGQKTVLSMSAA